MTVTLTTVTSYVFKHIKTEDKKKKKLEILKSLVSGHVNTTSFPFFLGVLQELSSQKSSDHQSKKERSDTANTARRPADTPRLSTQADLLFVSSSVCTPSP